MRMVLCARCVRDMESDREITRVGANSRKDQCQMCGRRSWCGVYDVPAQARRGKTNEAAK